MIKVSELRSAVRRLALTKCADEYSDTLNSYAQSQGKFLRPFVQTAVNGNLRASGYGKTVPSASPAKALSAAQKEVPAKTTSQPAVDWDAGKARTDLTPHSPAPNDYPGSRVIDALDWASSWPDRVKAWWARQTGSGVNGGVNTSVGATSVSK